MAMASVEEIVATHAGLIQDSKIWFAPNIPSNKLQGAINSYARGVPASDILMLVDNTIFGGAGDGMIITRDRLHAHDLGDPPQTINISEIRNANVIGTFGPKMFINGNKFVTFNCIDIHDKANHLKICHLVTDLSSGVASCSAPAIPPPGGVGISVSQECPGCGAQVRNRGVCEYCGRKL